MSITVRRAMIKDLETLYQIETECFTTEAYNKQSLANLLENANAVSLVVKINNVIAGFVIGLISRHCKTTTGHIYTLDVAVKYRRKGVGFKLLDEIEQIFAKRRVKTCYLEARKDNMAAIDLYHKRGYIEVEQLKDYYKGAHWVRLKKKLGV